MNKIYRKILIIILMLLYLDVIAVEKYSKQSEYLIYIEDSAKNKLSSIIDKLKNDNLLDGEVNFDVKPDGKWKKSHNGVVYAKHKILVTFKVYDEKFNDFKKYKLEIENIFNKSLFYKGSFIGSTTWAGYTYTSTKSNNGVIRMIREEKFSSAKGKDYFPDRPKIIIKTKKVPVYIGLEVKRINVEISDGNNNEFDKDETLSLIISGNFKTTKKMGTIAIKPEFKDAKFEERLDLKISGIRPIDDHSRRSKKDDRKIIIPSNKDFRFIIEVDTDKDFNIVKDLILNLDVFLSGKRNAPISFPLQVSQPFPIYIALIIILGFLSLIIGFYFYYKGQGIRHDKYNFSLKIISDGNSVTEYKLKLENSVVGRMKSDTVGIALDQPKVSRKHAVFF